MIATETVRGWSHQQALDRALYKSGQLVDGYLVLLVKATLDREHRDGNFYTIEYEFSEQRYGGRGSNETLEADRS